MNVALHTVEVAGIRYGTAPCWVDLFGSMQVPAVCCVAGDDKTILEASSAVRWLIRQSCPSYFAEALVEDARIRRNEGKEEITWKSP